MSGECPRLRGLLDSAKTSVVRAKGVLNALVAAKKQPAKAQESARGHLSAEGRKRISLAAKKRWATAKCKGMNAVTGRPAWKELHKTACVSRSKESSASWSGAQAGLTIACDLSPRARLAARTAISSSLDPGMLPGFMFARPHGLHNVERNEAGGWNESHIAYDA
jgi:hypothetical protein